MDKMVEKLKEHYNTLWEKLQQPHDYHDFYQFDELHCDIYGKRHPFCYYRRILIKNRIHTPLTDSEVSYFKQLQLKYGKVDVDYLIPFEELDNKAKEEAIFKTFKNTYDGISKASKYSHPAFSEFGMLMRNNIDFAGTNRELLSCFNENSLKELYNIIESFIEQNYVLDENITIRLTPRGVMHVITGHLSEFKIPRKGLLANFTEVAYWQGIIILLKEILIQMQEEIIVSFQENNRYDNKKISFNGNFYGLHIQKNKTISSFYPVATYKS